MIGNEHIKYKSERMASERATTTTTTMLRKWRRWKQHHRKQKENIKYLQWKSRNRFRLKWKGEIKRMRRLWNFPHVKIDSICVWFSERKSLCQCNNQWIQSQCNIFSKNFHGLCKRALYLPVESINNYTKTHTLFIMIAWLVSGNWRQHGVYWKLLNRIHTIPPIKTVREKKASCLSVDNVR